MNETLLAALISYINARSNYAAKPTDANLARVNTTLKAVEDAQHAATH